MKKERIKRRIYACRQEAKSDVFDYIEGFYSRYLRLRARMASDCEQASPLSTFKGALEADESHFDPRRVRGKRVYTEIIPKASKATLQAIIP